MIRTNAQLLLPTSKTENDGKPKLTYLSDYSETNIPTDETVVNDMSLTYTNGNLTITLLNSKGETIVSKTITIGTGGGNVYT